MDITETPSEHPLEENPSSSGSKIKLSKKKRKQIKKTLDLNKGVDKDNKNEEEIVGNVVEGGVDLLEENVATTDKLEESLTDHLPQNPQAEEIPEESSSETTITEESTAGDITKKSVKIETKKLTKSERKARRNIKKSKDKSNKAKQNLNEQEHLNIEEEDYSIKKEDEISEDNKELIQILTEKGYWNNLTKINSIDKTISLEDAINEVKKMVRDWGGKIFDPITKQFSKDNQAFTLISGSYLLEINSKESDTDFIVILYFNYEGPVENYATSLLWLNFMGIQSECNFEQRKECSKNKLDSFYCTLCRNEATTWLRRITSGVAEINAKIYGYSFDLAFVAYPLESNSTEILESEESLKTVEEVDKFIFNFVQRYGSHLSYNILGMLNSLSGYRASLQINYLITGSKEKFRILLLALKLWAKSKFIKQLSIFLSLPLS
uniref:Uncharacterized protein n=1 Tax=Meloidogyne enterolobii TaxID=390850 RepID=A0A6V7X4S0_MELEN|nr:unnamed protein product [Meloidogyne enterolobii]